MPTLFIWVISKDRYLARCWTRWMGEQLGDGFKNVVSLFRDVIDHLGDTRYHQWCSNQYHVDHVIPLAKGGWHHPDNLQVISASENVRKGAKVVLQIEQENRIEA